MNETIFSHVNPEKGPGKSGGPLAGLGLSIQPNLSVRGWPTQAGSRALEDYTAIEDATTVERLHDSGAWIVGSTRMAELGLGLAGDTAAASVAASHCDAALVTDSLGEARVAAAEARLVGYKPTFGIVSRHGLIGLIPSMECLGIVTREPATAAGVLAAIAGPDPRDFSLGAGFPKLADAGGGKIAGAAIIPQSLAMLDSDEVGAFHASLGVLEKAGLKIREAPIEDFELYRLVHRVVGAAEASSSAGKYDSVRYGHRTAKSDNWNEMYLKSRAESFGPLVKDYLFQGAYFQFRDYPAFEDACRIRRRLVEAVTRVLQGSDVIVLPTRRRAIGAGDNVSLSDLYDRFALTLAANVCGLPAISLPGFVRAGDEDLGLQVLGRSLEDGSLLDLAARLLSTPTGGGQ